MEVNHWLKVVTSEKSYVFQDGPQGRCGYSVQNKLRLHCQVWLPYSPDLNYYA